MSHFSHNPDARGNGQHDTCGLSLEQFFERNLPKLLRYCHSKWDGSGEDVMQEAMKHGTKYGYMTFSLFHDLCLATARDLKIARWQHDDERTIILPPTRRPKTVLKCENCGSTKFTPTMGHQLMCVCCGEKADPPAPVFDPAEDDDTDDIDTEKLEEIQENNTDPKIHAVIEEVLAGNNLVEATKKAGISYQTFRKKARQAYLQPSLFKNNTSDAYTGGAR